jgi:hypothetical protein
LRHCVIAPAIRSVGSERINLTRRRLDDYATGKRYGAFAVYVMVFGICCGKLHYGGILILLNGALKQEFYFNIIILAEIHGRHGIWNCVSNSTFALPEEIHGKYWPC